MPALGAPMSLTSMLSLLIFVVGVVLGAPAESESKVETFDYVIAGGGTAGLVLAVRLSENPQTSVIVLEAGGDHTDDLTILAPGLGGTAIGNLTYDWDYDTVPQKAAAGKVVGLPQGFGLGGSSQINIRFWTHASQSDLNNWGKLGNDGWSWREVVPYFKKSETFIQPDKKTVEDLDLEYLRPELYGKNGPIKISEAKEHIEIDEAWAPTYAALGLKVNGDPRDGLALGGYNNLVSLDSKVSQRSFAATGYLGPVRGRKNLKVVTEAFVEKILFADKKVKGKLVATGVKYRKGSTTLVVQAKKEVLLSAGAFGSPHILENSGYGSKDLLKKHGIPVVHDNPNVGENLQDHAWYPSGFEVKPGFFTYDDFRNVTLVTAAFEQYIANRTGLFAISPVGAALLSYAQVLRPFGGKPVDATNAASAPVSGNLNAVSRKKQYKLLVELLTDPKESVAQHIHVPGGSSPLLSSSPGTYLSTKLPGNYYTLFGVLERPFSRGSVHITSSDPSVRSAVDPNYLSHPLDAQILTDIGRQLDTVAQTRPLANYLKGGGKVVQEGYPALAGKNHVDWLKKSLGSEYHPCGTNSMLPENEGGVVNPELKVYGTTNLRVVDASIFPMIPQSNLQSLVYAVAERAAEWIIKDSK